jgi:hypothetical protein
LETEYFEFFKAGVFAKRANASMISDRQQGSQRDRQTDGRTDRQTGSQQAERKTDTRTDWQTAGKTDSPGRQTARLTEGKKAGQVDYSGRTEGCSQTDIVKSATLIIRNIVCD